MVQRGGLHRPGARRCNSRRGIIATDVSRPAQPGCSHCCSRRDLRGAALASRTWRSESEDFVASGGVQARRPPRICARWRRASRMPSYAKAWVHAPELSLGLPASVEWATNSPWSGTTVGSTSRRACSSRGRPGFPRPCSRTVAKRALDAGQEAASLRSEACHFCFSARAGPARRSARAAAHAGQGRARARAAHWPSWPEQRQPAQNVDYDRFLSELRPPGVAVIDARQSAARAQRRVALFWPRIPTFLLNFHGAHCSAI